MNGLTEDLLGVPACRGGHDQGVDRRGGLLRIGGHQHDDLLGISEFHSPASDYMERTLMRVGIGQQRGGDFAARVRPPGGVLRPVDQARVVDRHGCDRRQRPHGDLVGVREPAVGPIVGDVEASDPFSANADRHAEKGTHRRVRTEIGETYGLRVVGEQPEQARPRRRAAVRPVADERHQYAVGIPDSDRTETSTGHRHGGPQDVPQGRVHIPISAGFQRRGQQLGHSLVTHAVESPVTERRRAEGDIRRSYRVSPAERAGTRPRPCESCVSQSSALFSTYRMRSSTVRSFW